MSEETKKLVEEYYNNRKTMTETEALVNVLDKAYQNGYDEGLDEGHSDCANQPEPEGPDYNWRD